MALVFQDSGLAQGVTQAASAINEAMQQRAKQKQLQSILNPQPQQIQTPVDYTQDERFRNNFLKMIGDYENQTGEMLQPSQIDMAWNQAIKSQPQQAAQVQPSSSELMNRQIQAAVQTGNMPLATFLQQKQLAEQKMQQKESLEEKKYQQGLAQKPLEAISGLREALPKKRTALSMARQAVQSNDVGAFSPSRIGQAIGGPIGDALMSAKGAQLLTAGKENLLSNMSRVSARGQNKWFEQRLNSMFPQIGQSEEANLTIQEMLEGEVAMDDIYLKSFDKEYERDMKQYGYPRGDIDKRARQSAQNLESKIMERTNFRLKQIEEQEKGLSDMQRKVGKGTIKGTVLTPAMASLYLKKYGSPEKAMKVALTNGYKVPSKDDAVSYGLDIEDFMGQF